MVGGSVVLSACADVAELGYAPASEAGGLGHEGSTPSVRIALNGRFALRAPGLALAEGLFPHASRHSILVNRKEAPAMARKQTENEYSF